MEKFILILCGFWNIAGKAIIIYMIEQKSDKVRGSFKNLSREKFLSKLRGEECGSLALDQIYAQSYTLIIVIIWINIW